MIAEIKKDMDDFTLTKTDIINKAIVKLQEQVRTLENIICGLSGNSCNEIPKENKAKQGFVSTLANIPKELDDFSVTFINIGTELYKALYTREEVVDSVNIDDESTDLCYS